MEETNLDAGKIASTEAIEGINSEEVETTQEVETTDNVEEVELEDEEVDKEALKKKRNAEKVRKILAEKNEAVRKAQEAETKLALKDLQLQHWKFDEESVLKIKTAHPSLSLEDCYLLHTSKSPKPEEKPWDFWGIVWRETQAQSNIITLEQLRKLDQEQYSRTRDLIDQGKIILRW